MSCSAAAYYCLKLHSGAVVLTHDDSQFGDTATTSALFYYFDPDGKYSGSATGPGKSIVYWLYFNGRLKTWGTAESPTYSYYSGSSHSHSPDLSRDPTWFSWSN